LSTKESEKRGYGRFLNNETISIEDVLYEYVPEAPLSAQGQRRRNKKNLQHCKNRWILKKSSQKSMTNA
jgi:hypothetical protein